MYKGYKKMSRNKQSRAEIKLRLGEVAENVEKENLYAILILVDVHPDPYSGESSHSQQQRPCNSSLLARW